MADRRIRLEALEALRLQSEEKYADALTYATALARANPGSALAHNLAGTFHVRASTAAEGPPGDEEDASTVASRHRRAAVDSFSAAARIAPNCVMSGFFHAEALAADQRFSGAMLELFRVTSTPETKQDDPVVHHVAYDLVVASNAKTRKADAVYKASVVMEGLAARINNEIVPPEAVKLLDGDAAVDQVQARAKLLSEMYPYSVRAQLLRVHIDLEQVRATDQAVRRKGLLRRILALISHAADNFESSLLVALFHAKVLFALDEFGKSESECRRALRIEGPMDPNFEDIPPAISVPGADYESRVSSVKKQLRVLLKRIIVVAAKFLNTESLWQHMSNKHRDELWGKLQSVLDPVFSENASKGDHSLDGITLCQDSGQHDIFQLPQVQHMFESLLVSPSIGIRAEPLAEMRQRKCRDGSEILEDIKEKLKMLPEDTLSTEFEEFCFGIQNLWLKFLKISLLDYREVILPLARSFQWVC
uniref:Uncharacterized protein n=1 Tax=Avena sativa TaxID=4498 RepID=A0ACD5Y991_AVESA